MSSSRNNPIKSKTYKGPMGKYANDNGLKIKEAKHDMVITVNDTDLRGAKRLDPQNCGFAKACHRTHPAVNKVHFFRSVAYVEKGDTLERYIVPTAMTQELHAFDRGGKMGTGEFRLKRPSPAITLETLRKNNHEAGPRDTNSKPPRFKTKGRTGLRAFAAPTKNATHGEYKRMNLARKSAKGRK